MKKLQERTLQKFLDEVVDELTITKKDNKLTNEQLNIPFIISSIYQSFTNNTDKYKDFIDDLNNYSDYGIYIDDSQNTYNGLIDIGITLSKYLNIDDDFTDYECPEYNYKFIITYDRRDWGCCQCTPDMPDYREDKHCCGHGCDASFCTFELQKNITVIADTWQGDEHDYWNFEDEFYANHKELATKKAEEEKVKTIQILKNRIKADSELLAELENN